MKAILNQDIIDLENFKITYSNRGFRYGDGLFETIAFINGRPRLLEHHLQRMASQVATSLPIQIFYVPFVTIDCIYLLHLFDLI